MNQIPITAFDIGTYHFNIAKFIDMFDRYSFISNLEADGLIEKHDQLIQEQPNFVAFLNTVINIVVLLKDQSGNKTSHGYKMTLQEIDHEFYLKIDVIGEAAYCVVHERIFEKLAFNIKNSTNIQELEDTIISCYTDLATLNTIGKDDDLPIFLAKTTGVAFNHLDPTVYSSIESQIPNTLKDEKEELFYVFSLRLEDDILPGVEDNRPIDQIDVVPFFKFSIFRFCKNITKCNVHIYLYTSKITFDEEAITTCICEMYMIEDITAIVTVLSLTENQFDHNRMVTAKIQ